MGADVPKFIDLYCSGDKLAKNQEQCTSLAKIQCDIQRLKAQKLVELADKSGGGQTSASTYEQAGNTYFELWRKYGETPISAGQPAQCDKLDEIVYNAAKAFQAARLVARSINALRTLLEPKYHMDTSPLAKKAVYQIGGLYQAIAVYDQASDWYERYAQLDSKADKADIALSDATQLRLGLGQEDQAIKDAQLFTKSYGSSKPAQTAAIAFAVGAHYAEKEDSGEDPRGAQWLHERHRQGGAGRSGPSALHARSRVHPSSRQRRFGQGRIRAHAQPLVQSGRRGHQDSRRVSGRGRKPEGASSRQGAQRRRRSVFLRSRGRAQSQGRPAEIPGVPRPTAARTM